MVFEHENKKIVNINDIYRNNLLIYWRELEDILFNDEEITNLLTIKFKYLESDIAFIYFSVMFIDAYKILNYKFKSGNISINELEMFEFLKDIKQNDIELYSNYDSSAFKFISKYFKMYALENEFNKRTCFLNLEEEDNTLLKTINPYHSLDLKRYNSDIKTEQYLIIRENILNAQFNNIFISNDMLDTYLINSIIKFMKELYVKNYSNFHDNFKDMIKIVYGYYKYLVDHTKRDKKIEANITSKIENEDFDTLEQYAIDNYEFFKEIIASYLYYAEAKIDSYLNQNGEEIIFDNEDVKKYSKTLDKNIKIKLDIK